ncbi:MULTISPECIES: Uma2 family endonuclease [Pseudanabaena]|jgi:Uma2 family endonuclease|uniref:Uma2 family endonuclease n=1 Tax=Pseudanabaena TaxID=1152 RepID=UPI002478F331|nr:MULTISPECIES: Uma2 family endonuclease [Pseudanabaena]MEA5488442.1 Uma2 family endonuclease [Pseudanabaena sp. CCNP1317]WGS74245.1 Uma2 family endonuclease [Pseudanabaena galeata CCNP1313]
MVLLNVNPPSVSENIVNGDIDASISKDIKLLPIEIESDEPELESDLHREQINLLVRLLKYYWRDRQDVYVTGNLTVYYNPDKLTNRDFRGPDVFVVMDVEKRDRKSWVLWNEGNKYPNLVIELLSDSTAKVDRSTKKLLYQDLWRLPNYFWFDPDSLEFAGFKLVDGKYEAIAPNESGYLWSDQLELYLGIYEKQLRWFTADGELIPTAEERADKLEAILRSQGIDPNQLSI